MSNILVIVTGSVAAPKSFELLKQLKIRGFSIDVIMTDSAKKFVKKSDIEELLKIKVNDNLWSKYEAENMHHINLSRKNDYIVVYPATAHFLNKVAFGFADNLAAATILASDKKVIFVPAMNTKMYQNKVTKESLKKLSSHGHIFIGPDSGSLACGETGLGRLVEFHDVLTKINEMEQLRAKVSGKRVLISAGATIEPIDPVRYISNYSSGKQGYFIAKALHEFGAEVTFVYGKIDIEIDCVFHKMIEAKSANEMYDAVFSNVENMDLAILSAAVADYRPISVSKNKIKKTETDNISITLTKNPDILSLLCHSQLKPKVVVGFAAESENVIGNAKI
ncbi:MAG: bifunctional phosphopantothenoylcysteine decarboxylase/phosphopantothenate--cysteine ligase CoaBC, partial [Rickettsiales bacterium]|nr:bifunctional phosphopantothenoylcysteine decarboxylase/phosphopantothenate--cysteine ligase CoaBC [Rickettsiales bacterium]